MIDKGKWVLEGAYQGPYGKRYQFRSAEPFPGTNQYNHMEVGAGWLWGNRRKRTQTMQVDDLRQLSTLAYDMMDTAGEIESDMEQMQSVCAMLEDVGGTDADVQLLCDYLEHSAQVHAKMSAMFPYLLAAYAKLREGR